jgi:predicted permease
MRAALDAGRKVLAYFVSEAVLAVLGGIAGIVLAVTGVALLVRRGPTDLPRLAEVSVDWAALGVGFLASVVASLLATLVPAWRQGHVNLGAMLREGGRSGTSGPARQRARAALVAVQVALAMVLAGSDSSPAACQLRRCDRGSTRRRSELQARPPRTTYRTSADVVRFDRELQERLSALPGVRAVGMTSKLPLLLDGSNVNPISREDRPAAADELPPLATFARVTDTYFRAMGIPLVSGRTFTGMTDAQSPLEVVVSRNMATEQVGDSTGAGAVGKRLKALNGTSYFIIGVVETVLDSSLSSPPSALVYFPVVPAADSGADSNIVSLSALSVVVRTTGDPLAMAPAVRRVVTELDRSLPVYNLRAMDEMVSQSARLTFMLMVLAVAAGTALILGAVGLYGVVAYVVTLRTKEIGVRIALGAQPRTVGRGVARQGVMLALGGAAVGLVAFTLLARTLRSFLYGVAPTDPLTLLGVTVLLVAVAAAASWIPARRAARINPVERCAQTRRRRERRHPHSQLLPLEQDNRANERSHRDHTADRHCGPDAGRVADHQRRAPRQQLRRKVGPDHGNRAGDGQEHQHPKRETAGGGLRPGDHAEQQRDRDLHQDEAERQCVERQPSHGVEGGEEEPCVVPGGETRHPDAQGEEERQHGELGEDEGASRQRLHQHHRGGSLVLFLGDGAHGQQQRENDSELAHAL